MYQEEIERWVQALPPFGDFDTLDLSVERVLVANHQQMEEGPGKSGSLILYSESLKNKSKDHGATCGWKVDYLLQEI